MRLIYLLIFLTVLKIIPQSIDAQQVNQLYFMEDVPVRHFLNPSFQPETDFYISLPVIGFTQFNVGNNSVSLKDVVYKMNGRTITFLDPQGNIPLFYNTLKPNTVVRADLQTNLLSFGFRNKEDYWTLSVIEKMEGSVNLPKDLFKVALFGSQNLQANQFDLSKLQSDISAYTEIALGYSKQVNNRWVVGGKLKLLLGNANISNNNSHSIAEDGPEKMILDGGGVLNYSGPVQITNGSASQVSVSELFKPSGLGAGIDMGIEYQYNEKIKLSAALNDVGFIHWTKNTLNYHYAMNYNFNGITLFNNNSTINTFQDVYNQIVLGNTLSDSIVSAFNSAASVKKTANSYTTFTTAKLNLGFEYSLIKDQLSLGVLSYSQLFKTIVTEEITTSLNARPYKWLDTSLGYSLINGRFSTFGAGLGLKTGILHWFLAADYIPLIKANLPLTDLGIKNSGINLPIPYNSTYFNFSAGVNIVFNQVKKKGRGLIHSNKRNDCNCDMN